MQTPSIVRVSPPSGGDRALLLVKGYLSEGPRAGDRDKDWIDAIRAAGWRDAIYLFRWDASESAALVGRTLWSLTRFRGDWRVMAAATAASTVHHWLTVRRHAEQSGREFFLSLAEQEICERNITVAAHSAGARLVFWGLKHAGGPTGRIRDVILMGGAVSRGHRKEWELVVSRIGRLLVNVYNPGDWVLGVLYRLGQLTTRDACGRCPVLLDHPRIRNLDAGALVGRSLHNHAEYHKALSAALGLLEGHEKLLPDGG